MSDPTAVSVILDPLVLIFNGLRSIHWRFYFSWAVHLIALPLRLLLIPLRLIASALFVLFSPALYILGYIYGCVTTVLGFLASLEPLYTFFGAAATVGILTGLTLALSSTIITSTLGMQEDTTPHPSYTRPHHSNKGYIKDAAAAEEESYSEDDDQQRSHDDDESPLTSSTEKEWQWLEPSPSRRRPASGLLSQTILEEEDDSDQM